MDTRKIKIESINFTHDEQGEREAHVGLSNGETVKIAACYEGWEQYNATVDSKFVAINVAARVNGWLHGGEEPYVEDLIR